MIVLSAAAGWYRQGTSAAGPAIGSPASAVRIDHPTAAGDLETGQLGLFRKLCRPTESWRRSDTILNSGPEGEGNTRGFKAFPAPRRASTYLTHHPRLRIEN